MTYPSTAPQRETKKGVVKRGGKRRAAESGDSGKCEVNGEGDRERGVNGEGESEDSEGEDKNDEMNGNGGDQGKWDLDNV